MDRRLFLLVIAVAALSGCGREVTLKRGDVAPSFSLMTLERTTLRFPEDLSGRAVVVRFWADWCPYCRKEMEGIGPIVAQLAGQGISMLAVNVGQDEAKVRAFVDKVGVGYPALLDEQAATAKAYGVKALPTTFFIGSDGRIRNKLVGEADAATFERLARELLPSSRVGP